MGTKIECAIDPLASASANNNSFTLHYSFDDCRDYFQIRELKNKFHRSIGFGNNFRDSMDKMLGKHNLESIKKTMQIQEDIFKHQVQELHRLYSVQKKLMTEMKEECRQQNTRVWSSTASSDVNHSQFINKRSHSLTPQKNSGYMLNYQNMIEDPSSRERSGSCSGETMKMARGFDLEMTVVEDLSTTVSAMDNEDQAAAGPSTRLSNNKMSIDGSDDESGVELTLSIGVNSSSKKKRKQQTLLRSQEVGCLGRELDSPASFKSDLGEDFSSPNTSMSSSSATFDQEKKMPHWLFGLSINRS